MQATVTAQNGLWHIRPEEASGDGRAIDFATLARAVEDGVISESFEARGPGESAWRAVGDHPALAEFVPWTPLIRNRPYDDADMDMTPMIDVTFQLLIFFMITACFVVQKTLPAPDSSRDDPSARAYTMAELQQNNIVVQVKADGVIRVDGQPVELDALDEAIRAAASGRSNVELVLDAEDPVKHGLATRVYDAAAGAQINKVMYAVRAKSKPQEKPTPKPNP